jgi:DNA repair photolyase
MIKEIQAKVMLSHVKQPDDWFGLKYSMNLYRGCQHQCIYCDSRSECYRIENFKDVRVKVNALELLRKELRSKRVKGTIGTGSMNDPYMPLEKRYNLTGQALTLMAQYRFPVHVITKSDLVLRDIETLVKISEIYAAVSFTITTSDDALAKKLEPGAPLVSKRLEAMKALAERGILTGVTMMPLLPFIEDNEKNIVEIVEKAHAAGASYIIPWFGMSLRDRQRAYYYEKLDRLFPGLRSRYQREFGNAYSCASNNAVALEQRFSALCRQYSISNRMPAYQPKTAKQLSLF